jgi:hypothetical protein
MLSSPTTVFGVRRWIAICHFHLLLCLLAMPVTTGCGRHSELEMAVVSGTVTYEGKPLEDGEIRFVPTGDTKGPTSATVICNGRYEVAARGGVPAGMHRVELRAFRIRQHTQPLSDLPGAASGKSPKEQYLPQKYNVQSDLTTTIESGQSKVTKDFTLGDR